MKPQKNKLRRNGLLSLSSLLVMAALFVGLSFLCGGFSKVPILIVFLLTSVWSLFTLRGLPLERRVAVFSHGASQENLLMMVWIFILAGSFASTAKAMGAVEATVSLTMQALPSSLLLPGIFLAACFVSLSVGTSVGTVVALVPIGTAIASAGGMSNAVITAAIVGGAFFGDNLSFISDTTVVATRTQGCRMQDKFRTNFLIALPPALLTLIIYTFMARESAAPVSLPESNIWLVLPYIGVLVAAIAGMNVMAVLLLGLLLAGGLGLLTGALTLQTWFDAICSGIGGMGELIIVSLLAGGLFSVIRKGGGITWLIRRLTRRVSTPKGAMFATALLVSLTNLCTANNTVAILSVGNIAHDISERFSILPRRMASLLDTFSCVVQGIIPYGAQLLMAGGLAGLAPTEIVPCLFYPMLLGISSIVTILLVRTEKSAVPDRVSQS